MPLKHALIEHTFTLMKTHTCWVSLSEPHTSKAMVHVRMSRSQTITR